MAKMHSLHLFHPSSMIATKHLILHISLSAKYIQFSLFQLEANQHTLYGPHQAPPCPRRLYSN